MLVHLPTLPSTVHTHANDCLAYGGKEGRLGAWKALVEAVEEGKVRSIGVSNYGVHHLDELEQWQKVGIGFASSYTSGG